MKKLLQLSLTFTLLLSLLGCAENHFPFVYRIDIPQGNIITDEQLAKLQPGMTPEQVNFLLGTPLLIDPFHQNQWDYIYQFTPGSTKKREGEKFEKQLLRVYFENGVVEHFKFIEKDEGKAEKEVEKGSGNEIEITEEDLE